MRRRGARALCCAASLALATACAAPPRAGTCRASACFATAAELERADGGTERGTSTEGISGIVIVLVGGVALTALATVAFVVAVAKARK